MQEFNVFVSLESFSRGFGEIYIKLNDYVFPGNKWTDFSENLLSWWTQEFTKLLVAEETKVKCGFMDGAVRFDVEALSKVRWRIQCIREYASSEECEYESEIDALQASKSLIQAVDTMLKSFREKGDQKAFDFLNERKQKLISAVYTKPTNEN